MGVEPIELVAELKKLRKGRGVQSSVIESVVGPALREVCGIGANDGPSIVRERTIERLGALAECLPPDLSLVVRVALALQAEVAGQFLHDRIRWLAQHQDRDARTIRRRVDDGLARLAEAAIQRDDVATGDDRQDWHMQDFEAVLRLDLASPTCYERRTIVADSDHLDTVTILYTIPRESGDPADAHEIQVDINYGARVISRERVSDSLFRFVLQLPAVLRRGTRHEYGMIVRLPHGQPMRPHYVYVPERPCERFELRVRFPADRAPSRVERVSAAFHRAIDESSRHPEMIHVDSVDEVRTRFVDLAPRYGYGIRWNA
jgi:hypothetical protein